MRILVDNELLEFTDDELAWLYMGAGNESLFYQYRDEALKIYNFRCTKYRLVEEDALKLKEIATKRILLPSRIIRNPDNGEFVGYTTKLIKKASITGIIRMKMGEFMSELDILRSDAMLLADHNVDLEDFNLNNTAYNGKIYFVDPGSYAIKTNPEAIRFVRSNNSFALNTYVEEDVFGMVNLTKAEKRRLSEKCTGFEYIGDFLRETADEKESVRQYVKRMAR